MAKPFILFWVILLALLAQVAAWRNSAPLSAGVASVAEAAHPDATEEDATEQASEAYGPVDDLLEFAPPTPDRLSLSGSEAAASCHCWNSGLPSGRPASNAPFKPPRA